MNKIDNDSVLSYSQIRDLDLNLLKVFAAIELTRSVTKSAKVLGISQSAMSHALARLRLALNDELFVKTSKQMSPTPRAIKCAPDIRRILSAVQSTLIEGAEFSPEKLQRVFNLKTTDFLEALLIPRLLRDLEVAAPGVQISTTSSSFSLPKDELEQGTCELGIAGFFGKLPDGFYQQKLFEDGFACAVRKEHPTLGRKRQLSLDAFCKERHLLIAPSGDLSSILDDKLRARRQSRLIVAGLSNFMTSGWIVSESNTVLTGPSRLISLLAQSFALNVLTVPLPEMKISIVQVWHQRNHQDPAHKWFRRKIHELLREES